MTKQQYARASSERLPRAPLRARANLALRTRVRTSTASSIELAAEEPQRRLENVPVAASHWLACDGHTIIIHRI